MKSTLSYAYTESTAVYGSHLGSRSAFRLLDPFKMHGFYDNYIYPSPTANKGMVSLRNFTRYDPVRHFDSFITGSSVSCNYLVEDWQRHIGTQSRPFHFDSSGQTITSLTTHCRVPRQPHQRRLAAQHAPICQKKKKDNTARSQSRSWKAWKQYASALQCI